MKLFVESCKTCQNKIYLDVVASSRSELRTRFGGDFFYAHCQKCQTRNVYSINEVTAEAEKTGTPTGGIVGGLIGLIGGPIGLLIGAGVGAAIGNSVDEDEQKKVHFFNASR